MWSACAASTLVDTHRVVTTLRPPARQAGGALGPPARGYQATRCAEPPFARGRRRTGPNRRGLQRDGAAPGLGEDLVETQQAVGIRPRNP